ncbi:MAG: hypothetical protein ACFFG0_04825 [Candidatus Thorarchaeota archaeon]
MSNREEFNKKFEEFSDKAYELGCTLLTLLKDTFQEAIDFIKKYSKKENNNG